MTMNKNMTMTTNAEGRKPTVTPMSFLADLGNKLMYGETLTETEAHYLRSLLPDETHEFNDLHLSLHSSNGANLKENERGVLQLLLDRERVRLYGE